MTQSDLKQLDSVSPQLSSFATDPTDQEKKLTEFNDDNKSVTSKDEDTKMSRNFSTLQIVTIDLVLQIHGWVFCQHLYCLYLPLVPYLLSMVF